MAALLLLVLIAPGAYGAPFTFEEEPELSRFMANPSAATFGDLKRHYRRQIEALGVARLAALERSQKVSLFLVAIKVYCPQLLPRDFPGRAVYLTCFVELYKLSKNLADIEL